MFEEYCQDYKNECVKWVQSQAEVPAAAAMPGAATPAHEDRRVDARRRRAGNPKLTAIIREARDVMEAVGSQREACETLARRGVQTPTPWGNLGWSGAYRSARYGRAVKKWLSKHAPMQHPVVAS